jgi:proline iminopeptidase
VITHETLGSPGQYGAKRDAAKLAFVRIRTHYFGQGAWLNDGQLLRDGRRLADGDRVHVRDCLSDFGIGDAWEYPLPGRGSATIRCASGFARSSSSR